MPFNRRTITLAGGALALLAAAILTVALFQLRSERGDTYAPYSTYRADPLGMMALFGALERAMPDARVERFVQPFEQMPPGPETTFIIAGAMLGPDPVPILERIESFALRGGRVVIAFYPLEQPDHLDEFRESMGMERPDEDPAAQDASEDVDDPDAAGDPETGEASVEPEDAGHDGEEEVPALDVENGSEPQIVDISERWGFDYGFHRAGEGYFAERHLESASLEAKVAWRTSLYFEPSNDAWTPIYTRQNRKNEGPEVLLMERKMGSGSIVLSSDSYFLSNEALRKERAPGLVQWVVGSNPTVLFSEVHLGTQRQDRVMTLIRRYRLHGVLFGFVLLGLLFVWKNATTLIPRRDRTSAESAKLSTDLERSHQEGLDNLLVRFIPQDQLMETCLREWLQHHQSSIKAPVVRGVYDALQHDSADAAQAGAVSMYNEIVREVQKR